jgi:hypothetical protein
MKWEEETQCMDLLAVYVQLLASLSNHPSRRLASLMIKDWLKVSVFLIYNQYKSTIFQ